MSDNELARDGLREISVPVIEEEARVIKRAAETERVTVRAVPYEEQIVLQDQVSREDVEISRVPINREVIEVPVVRIEGDVTILPIFEERVVLEKRLFLVEELHLRRRTSVEQIEIPTTVRRTRVDVERENLTEQKDN